MKRFLDHNFLLSNRTAERLYHEFAKPMPIIDYHCHLPPDQIATDLNFNNITHAWLQGDHYKWRAMRANGVDESYCTGSKPDDQKFLKWAETVPYTLRNPLYHWTHLELQRYFDISVLLDANSAMSVYEETSAKLQSPEYSVQGLLHKMNVLVVCTTDDPVDALEFHKQLQQSNAPVTMYPAFRPDKAMNPDDPFLFNEYVSKLETVSGMTVVSYQDYVDALKQRHDFFASVGCTVSDHGLEYIYSQPYTEFEVNAAFNKLRRGEFLEHSERDKFRSALLFQFAIWDWEKGWVQQFHLGALRNNNKRMMSKLGPDTGWDSMGDFNHGRSMSSFFSRLDENDQLAKTVIYNLNPADNELFATMAGNFNDGTMAGKIQYGSAWWFLDQKDGMTKQLNVLSNMGLLSRFVGMLTDSRSFLSFPRHEYFRRILCNLFGKDIENGELPADINWVGQVVQDICYNNAKRYFNFVK